MAEFMTNLWESVFTPGTTPTLLIATNASFAALQTVLFVLLLMTYNIHFAILSLLSGGLWWAINWFSQEIRKAQATEDEAKRIREQKREQERQKTGPGGEGEGMDSGDDTEVETELDKSAIDLSISEVGPHASTSSLRGKTALSTGAQSLSASKLQDPLRKRRGSGDGTEISTDSEWEKISEEGA